MEFYVKSVSRYKHEISQIEIELNDGSNIKQWAAWELWVAYRGSSVTHYAIESFLMSLEKYLLETAGRKNETSKKNIKFMFNYLLKNSNNVAVTGVLVSVAIAYPEEVEEEMLPLLTVKEFYDWEITRTIHESSTLSPQDSKIAFAQEERWKSNQLPHRTKYMRGLGDFIVDYQFKVRKLNNDIHKLFDKLQTKVTKDDVVWKKRLTEIDIRNWEFKEYDEKLGGVVIQPKYDADVNEFMNSNQESFAVQNTSINYSSIIKNTYELKEPIAFQKWKEIYKFYFGNENINILYDRPVSLAIIGLRDFINDLNKEEKEWCIEILSGSIVAVIQDTFSRNYGINRSFNLLEKEIILSSFHFIFSHAKDENDKNGLISLMIYMLFCPFADYEFDKITEYFRTVFFKHHPLEAKRVWVGLIKYSQFRKANPYFYDDPDTDRLNNAKQKEDDFIQALSSSKDVSLNFAEIDLENCQGNILVRAFVMTPYDLEDKIFVDFSKHFIPLLTRDLKFEEDYSYNQRKQKRQIHSDGIIDAEFYLTELLLKANVNFSKQVLDLILDPIYSKDFEIRRTGKDLFEFSSKILEQIIYRIDNIIANSVDEVYNKKLAENFWKIWEYLFEKIKNSGKLFFTSTILLGIDWKKDASHWKVLENKKEFYHQMVRDLGSTKTQSILNLFSSAGEKTFLPEGISWIVEIYKNDNSTTVSLISPAAERLIKRLFYNHISIIKSNKILIEDFVWILNRMVDLGSSEAYLFRENVITYKSFSQN